MTRPFWPAALLTVLSACSAADEREGGRRLGELSADEVQELCDSLEAALANSSTQARRCTLNAASNTDSAAACEVDVEQCLQVDEPDTSVTCSLPSRQHDADCAELPVDEVLPCVDELVDQRMSVSCDDAPYTPPPPPECIMRLTARCPFGA